MSGPASFPSSLYSRPPAYYIHVLKEKLIASVPSWEGDFTTTWASC